MAVVNSQVVTDEWVSFPGGELEGKRPKALCGACREICPVKINIPEVLIHLRGEVVRQKQDEGGVRAALPGTVAGGTLTHSKPRSMRSNQGSMKSLTLGLN